MGTRTVDVVESQEAGRIRPLLASDPVAAAYLLGNLAERTFGRCRWLLALHHEVPISVVLVYPTAGGSLLLSHGAPDGVAAVLAEPIAALPETGAAKVPLEHVTAFESRYRFQDPELFWCMGRTTREPLPPTPPGMRVRRLSPDEPQEPLLALYADHPGSYFDPGQLATGLYFGVEEGERLVAVAGTHVLAPGEGIAVVGNAVTLEDARGRGCAEACISALVAALHAQGCPVVALQVSASNAVAISAYRHAGFSFRSALWQTGLALRRPPWASGAV